MITLDSKTKEWVVTVETVYYCKNEHEPVAMMDKPECPVCEGPMSEIGWFEHVSLQSV